MKINKNKLKVGYIFAGGEGCDEVVVSIDKKNGEVFCIHLQEEGNVYQIEKDGSIETDIV